MDYKYYECDYNIVAQTQLHNFSVPHIFFNYKKQLKN